MDWLQAHKIPIGDAVKTLVDLLNTHAAWFFNFISLVLGSVILALITLLKAIPPLVLVAVLVAGAYALHRSWKLALLVLVGLLLIINQGYWKETLETLSLVVFATLVCMAVGVPLGIAAAHRPQLYAVLRPILDLMQTIPTFVYLIPALILFGLGVVPGLIATVIFALPAPVRLTHLGISNVPKALLEAGESFGASRRQLLWKVELPHALPTIMAGLTQCIMLSLSMVVIAALVGADGLGKPVVRALNTVNIARGFEAGLAIVILAILLDRVCKRPSPGRAG
jgi:glycine betaine/proline transport system permease protein